MLHRRRPEQAGRIPDHHRHPRSQATNPVYEFDGCFDPNGDNTPTGNEFPSLLATTTTALLPDSHRVSLQLSCGTGSTGCKGSVKATAGSAQLGTVPFGLKEEQTAKLQFARPVPNGAKDVTFTFTTTKGVGPPVPSLWTCRRADAVYNDGSGGGSSALRAPDAPAGRG